jgi:sec-independent protein translocase protein TatC
MSDRLPSPDATIAVITELRRRLVRMFVVVIAFSGVGWYLANDLLRILQGPFAAVMGTQRALYYTAPAEAFMASMIIGLVFGVLAAAPYLAWQLWRTFAPVFRRQKPWRFILFAMLTAVTFVAGALFGYFYVLPAVLKFLVAGFEQRAQMDAFVRVRPFVNFSLKLLLAFGLSFELPVMMFVLGRLGLVSARTLWRGFRYAVVLILVAAAIFTPPDVVSQIMLAVPLLILYLLGVGAVAITGKRKARAETAEETEQPPAG